MLKKMIPLKTFKMTFCCAVLASVMSCSNDDAVATDVAAIAEVASVTSANLTAKTYTAPASSSAFSSALAKCKLQSDYLSSDQKDLSSYASYFFYLSSSKMILYNAGGSSTRTELRRTDNFNKTSSRKMTINANLVSQPSGEVTVAQLHNENAELPVLRISVTGNTISYKLNKEPVKGTSLTNNGSFTTTLPSSKALAITLELTGDKYVSATVNGEKRTFKIEDAWGSSFDNAYYFKTGVYCQSSGTAKMSYTSLSWD